MARAWPSRKKEGRPCTDGGRELINISSCKDYYITGGFYVKEA